MSVADRNRFKLFEFAAGVLLVVSGVSSVLSRQLNLKGWYAEGPVALIVALFFIIFGVVMIRVGLPRSKSNDVSTSKRR